MSELPRVGVLVVALVAALAFEHFVIHAHIVIPAQIETGTAPLWGLAAMVAPELVVFFAIGYGLRTAVALPMYAALGALVRAGFQHLLAVTGQMGHTDPALRSFPHLALAAGSMAIAYLLVLALAASGAAEQREAIGER